MQRGETAGGIPHTLPLRMQRCRWYMYCATCSKVSPLTTHHDPVTPTTDARRPASTVVIVCRYASSQRSVRLCTSLCQHWCAAAMCLWSRRRGLKLDVADEEADNKYREQYFNFYDARLMGVEWAKQPNVELTTEFFRLLGLCHTVIPDGTQHM